MLKKNILLVLLLLLHLFLLASLQFTAWPEMLSYPYLRNNGFVLYRDMVVPYPPILVMALAFVYEIFGYGEWTIKLFTWFLILLNDVLIFIIVKKIVGKVRPAIASVAFYAFLQPILEGNMIWPDVVLVTPLLLSTLLFINKKLFWSGIMFALATLTKQTGVFYFAIAFLFLLFNERKISSLKNFILGSLVICIPFLLRLMSESALSDFLNWVFLYPLNYWTKFPGYIQMSISKLQIITILLLVAPVIFGVFKLRKKLFKDKYFLLLAAFLIAGFVGIYPRFSFFHFQPGLAFLVILYAILRVKVKSFYSILAVSLLTLLLILIPKVWATSTTEVRFYGKRDLELGSKIASQTVEEDGVFLLGLPSSLYVFADRLPPKPWIDNFGWYFEVPSVQEQMLERWEIDPPKYILWQVPERGNWFDLGVYQPKKITEWIAKNYNKVEEVELGVWLWRRK